MCLQHADKRITICACVLFKVDITSRTATTLHDHQLSKLHADMCWFQFQYITIWRVSQLSAHHTGISVVPEVITDGAPSVIDTHFYPP